MNSKPNAISTNASRKRIAGLLLSIGAVALQPSDPFTWSSGLKSPIYCDNRLTLSHPDIREEIAADLAEGVRRQFPSCQLIAGTATAGIPHAALVSDRLKLSMVYVRSKAKVHGKGKQIEGIARPGQKAVVVEDLISTGQSAISAAEALRKTGVQVLGIAAIFSYDLAAAASNLKDADLPLFTLTDFPTLVAVAAETGSLSEAEITSLQKWHQNPQTWLD